MSWGTKHRYKYIHIYLIYIQITNIYKIFYINIFFWMNSRKMLIMATFKERNQECEWERNVSDWPVHSLESHICILNNWNSIHSANWLSFNFYLVLLSLEPRYHHIAHASLKLMILQPQSPAAGNRHRPLLSAFFFC